MARQSTTPVEFRQTTRRDASNRMVSGRAGDMHALHYIPMLRGDSCAGNFSARFDLAEMPKPLQNAVFLNVQAWFVPKAAFPQFAGYDEFLASYNGTQITALGQADRDPPPFFNVVEGADLVELKGSTILKDMGIHLYGDKANSDLTDAYNLIWNFRAAAHSNKIDRRPYFSEGRWAALAHAPAFWPQDAKFSNVVSDYEAALLVGSLDLDVAAGSLPVSGIGIDSANAVAGRITPGASRETGGEIVTYDYGWDDNNSASNIHIKADTATGGLGNYPAIFAEMAGQSVISSLASVEKAKLTQAFGKLQASYKGNNASGFDDEDAIVAELMQGFKVPEDYFKRPWLLDSQRTTFGMVERHATDAANLDQSVTKGAAEVRLSINLPRQETGGYIVIVAEVVPERLYERQGDPALHITDVSELPNALRDIQRPEPVDLVLNSRIDARHSLPNALYGYEPMNAKWDRDFTGLGGIYYQADPANPFLESRSGIWQPNIVDPNFTYHHYVCPQNFPHDVFADTLAPAFEAAFRCNLAIRGLTQIGDVLIENDDEYADVSATV